jgi:hypothetical protein
MTLKWIADRLRLKTRIHATHQLHPLKSEFLSILRTRSEAFLKHLSTDEAEKVFEQHGFIVRK